MRKTACNMNFLLYFIFSFILLPTASGEEIDENLINEYVSIVTGSGIESMVDAQNPVFYSIHGLTPNLEREFVEYLENVGSCVGVNFIKSNNPDILLGFADSEYIPNSSPKIPSNVRMNPNELEPFFKKDKESRTYFTYSIDRGGLQFVMITKVNSNADHMDAWFALSAFHALYPTAVLANDSIVDSKLVLSGGSINQIDLLFLKAEHGIARQNPGTHMSPEIAAERLKYMMINYLQNGWRACHVD